VSPGRRRDDAARDTPAEQRPVIRPGGLVDPDALRAQAPERAVTDPDLLPDQSPDEADDDTPRRVVFRLRRDLQKRLDRYLTDRIPFMSRTQLRRLIENEQVTVNGRPPKPSTTLRVGDVVEVLVPPPPPSEIQPEEIPLEILFEDESLCVVNKRPGIIVHPARSHNSGTMVNALAWHFRERSQQGGALSSVGSEFARPGVVHRLDRDTSGVIVFAKSDEAHWKLARQFEKRTVDKRYLALVEGDVEPRADVIDLPIGPHPSREKGHREKYVVRHDELGKPSVTIYRVVEAFDGYSLVEVELKTGRTHQIRVHMTHRGWPLVGDDMYGGRRIAPADIGAPERALPASPDPWETPGLLMGRQALHAATLTFRHPITGESMHMQAPAPADFARTVFALRGHRPGEGRIAMHAATLDLDTVVPPEAPAGG